MAFEQYLPWPTRMERLTEKLDAIIAELELFLDPLRGLSPSAS